MENKLLSVGDKVRIERDILKPYGYICFGTVETIDENEGVIIVRLESGKLEYIHLKELKGYFFDIYADCKYLTVETKGVPDNGWIE